MLLLAKYIPFAPKEGLTLVQYITKTWPYFSHFDLRKNLKVLIPVSPLPFCTYSTILDNSSLASQMVSNVYLVF